MNQYNQISAQLLEITTFFIIYKRFNTSFHSQRKWRNYW